MALFGRQSGEPLTGPGRAGGEGARIIVARLASIALEPDDAKTSERRRVERVADRKERTRGSGLGGADEKRARGRYVAFGEGD